MRGILVAVDAGDFSSWLGELQEALRPDGDGNMDVPCGGCTACCTSSQFVEVGPDETDALAHIPAELLFPAPRRPTGHMLLGYDERGHCPMLIDGRCSIYEHRPRACRTYDCRIFPAAGITPDDDKPLIAEQSRRWRFTHPTEADRTLHTAVRAAATHLTHVTHQPDAHPTTNATHLALEALEIHPEFL